MAAPFFSARQAEIDAQRSALYAAEAAGNAPARSVWEDLGFEQIALNYARELRQDWPIKPGNIPASYREAALALAAQAGGE